MNEVDVKLRIAAIELLGKNMSRRDKDIHIGDEFNFNIRADAGINAPQKSVLYTIAVEVSELNRKDILGSIVVGISFFIENFDEIIKQIDDNKYKIPPDIDALLRSMSLSTTRGIMFSEFIGTYLYKAVLPIVLFTPENVKEMTADKKVEAIG